MASPDSLDFDRLLAPIPGEQPAGIDLRADSSPSSVYYQLKDARSSARTAERRQAEEMLEIEAGEEPPGVPPMATEWRVVLDLAPEVLATQTKDLEVAAWLTEALTRSDGAAGLRDGFRLMAGLVRDFWDGLYPLPDEDGIETRVAPVTGLNGAGGEGALVQPIRNIPLTDGTFRFAAWHHQIAHRGGGVITVEQWETSVRETSPQFFATLLEDVEGALLALDELDEALRERCGHDAPPISALRGALADVRDIVRSAAPETAVAPAAEPAELAEADAAAAVVSAAPGAPAPGPSGELRTREDAFAMLEKVAEFFRRMEPHSPLSYTLDELVRRGRMSLPELLQHLLPDDEARHTFLVRAGITPPEPEG